MVTQEKRKLEELKKTISYLSEDEAKRVVEAFEKGENTGYPNIDMPWEKQYVDSKDYPSDRTIFEHIYENNRGYLDENAIKFIGNTYFNWEEVIENAKDTVKALDAYGVKKGSVVSYHTTNIPEYVSMMLAISYLGATLSTIPLYVEDTQKNVEHILNESDSELLFVMDGLHFDSVKEAVKNSKVKETIVIPALNSSKIKVAGTIINYLKNPKLFLKLQENSKYLKWNTFIKEGKKRTMPEMAEFDKSRPYLITNSSGSTGVRPEAVLHTESAIIEKAKSYASTGINIDRGSEFYAPIPNWFSTGGSTSIFMPMFYGALLNIDPRFSQELFIKKLLTEPINYTVAAASMFDGFKNSKMVNKYYVPGKKDLTQFRHPFQGGMAQNASDVRTTQKAMESYGFKHNLMNGFGTTENAPGIATQTPIIHTPGSSGIPLPSINIRIVDAENNDKPLKYNEMGEIRVYNPNSTMLGYLGNDEKTKEYFSYDEDGTKWNKVGDYGYIDDFGEVYVLGRGIDYTLINDKKIYNFLLNKVISKDEDVFGVTTFTQNLDSKDEPVVHIVLSDAAKKLSQANSNYINSKISEWQQMILEEYKDIDWVPERFKLYDAFPVNVNTKINKKKMMTETEDIITSRKFDIDEIKDVKRKTLEK